MSRSTGGAASCASCRTTARSADALSLRGLCGSRRSGRPWSSSGTRRSLRLLFHRLRLRLWLRRKRDGFLLRRRRFRHRFGDRLRLWSLRNRIRLRRLRCRWGLCRCGRRAFDELHFDTSRRFVHAKLNGGQHRRLSREIDHRMDGKRNGRSTPKTTTVSPRRVPWAGRRRCGLHGDHCVFFFVSKATLEMPSWRVVSSTSMASPSRASSSPLMKILSSALAFFSAASLAESASSDSSSLSR